MSPAHTLRISTLLATCLLLLIVCPQAQAKGAYIGNLTVLNTPRGLRINATLINGFTRKVMEAIQSGAPITLEYEIELKERKSMWPDENIVKRIIKRSVAYNSLDKKYRFTSVQGPKNRTAPLKTMKDVRHRLIQLRNIPLISSRYLKPNKEYYIRIKARMNAESFWFPFNYILFFIDFLNFETPWLESATIVINRFPVTDEHERSLENQEQEE